MSDTDAVTVTTVVSIDAGAAFEVFTAEVDAWWRREPRFRGDGGGVMRFEPGVGGRLIEVGARGGAIVELGRVKVWEPGRRLVLAWTGASQVAGAPTEVEIRFEPEPLEPGGPGGSDAATRVTLVHRGWDAVPVRHPSRGGLMGGAFTSVIGSWWADLATSLRRHTDRR